MSLSQKAGADPAPSVSERLDVTLAEALDKLQELVAYLPLLVVAALVVAVFAVLAHFAGRWRAPFSRLRLGPFAADLAQQAVKLAIFLVGLLIALELLDATALVGAVLGTAGVMGIAVGFAFRDLIENYIASILLSVRQPFEPSDHVVIDGHEGKVIRLTSRATILMTLDGNHLRIPNAQVFKGVILNYSRNPHRRFTFKLGIGVAEDLVAARTLGVETLLDTPGVTAEPKPEAIINEVGDSSVAMAFFGWVDQRKANFSKVRGEAIRRVKAALEEAGLDLPEPIYRLQVRQMEAERQPPSESKPAAEGAPAIAEVRERELDTSPGDAVDRQIAADRAEGGNDLLHRGAPQE